MVDSQIFEEQHDLRRVPDDSLWSNKFELLAARIESLNKEIITTRNCIDYVYKQVLCTNEKISGLYLANTRRLVLVQEMQDKLGLLTDQRDTTYSEMLELIPKDVFDMKLN